MSSREEDQQELPVDEDTAWEMFLERNIRNAVTSNEDDRFNL